MKRLKRKISGWGNFPVVSAQVYQADSMQEVADTVSQQANLIAYGNGRSYGDSALNKTVVDNKTQNLFLSFDVQTGLLEVQSGVLLRDIIDVFVPKGWFLRVTPGTKLITVGGAIASDVHGKNHHNSGCFSECLESFEIILANGKLQTCSNTETPELFKATCGGQGLTGVIVSAKIYLKKIKSQFIQQTTIKSLSLRDTFDIFEQHADADYSVAWVDCLARGPHLGRSLVDLGEFCGDGDLFYTSPKRLKMPINLPSFVLNKWSVKAFNALYYHRQWQRRRSAKVGLDAYFYPLDAIQSWNKLYGKKGFIQYQAVIPIKHSYDGIQRMLSKISESGKGSFLAVLKLHGEQNDNYLSFPMAGYSLALDFKIEHDLFALLKELDAIVVELGGRVYLAKDSRVSRDVFEVGYKKIDVFRRYRQENNMNKKFCSQQSDRLGL